MASATNGVQSIERAFSILRAVSTEPAGISEVARRVSLPISTTARLLATLEELHAVVRIDATTYAIGSAVTELAASADPTAALLARASVHLDELVSLVGEAVGLAVADGERAVRYIDQVEADHEVQLRDWTGTCLPLHVVSSGLVMLAARSDAAIDRYLSSELTSYTAKTMTNPTKLRARLRAIAHDGVVWTSEEFHEGITSVAAPVFGADGSVVAALHCHGPSFRFPRAGSRQEVARAVIDAARRLSTPNHVEQQKQLGA